MEPATDLCPPLDGTDACAPLPAAFSRVRYFYGKRLSVSDFVDQQLYHASKLRFHNRHAHGAGVLCGLGITPFGGSSNMLRVGKGAALDRCGREIVVGWDQCIDLNAWIQSGIAARKAKKPSSQWPQTALVSGKLELAVVLRYAECAVGPEPAPRDACSCDDGGCQFGRIREGFSLEVVEASEVGQAGDPARFPSYAGIETSLANAVTPADFGGGLSAVITASAGQPADEDGLLLGTLKAAVDSSNQVTGVELTPLSPGLLLVGTGVLQELFWRALTAQWEPAALLGDSPTIVSARFDTGSPRKIVFELSSPIIPATAPKTRFALHRLDPSTGWVTANAAQLSVTVTTSPDRIELSYTNADGFFAPSQQYRVAITGDDARPICDASMRPLLPLRFAWDFATDSTGAARPAPFATP
jgi:hypothetical protein